MTPAVARWRLEPAPGVVIVLASARLLLWTVFLGAGVHLEASSMGEEGPWLTFFFLARRRGTLEDAVIIGEERSVAGGDDER